MAAVIVSSTITAGAQISNSVTETVKIYGNCGMCESSIEKAGGKKSTAKVDWNEENKLAVITYDSKKTNLHAVLKNIALAGYDSREFLAPDEAYAKLPGCCKYDREKKKNAAAPAKETEMMNPAAHNAISMSDNMQQTKPFQGILDNYFTVKDALVKTDVVSAAEKAAGLVSALNAVKMETLKPADHNIWMNEMKGLKTAAQEIAGSKAIEKQRAYFATLSTHVYALIKASAPAEKVYYQNCPMYNDGKGANWLSKESGIKNPYYGSMMLTCGKTVEEIQ